MSNIKHLEQGNRWKDVEETKWIFSLVFKDFSCLGPPFAYLAFIQHIMVSFAHPRNNFTSKFFNLLFGLNPTKPTLYIAIKRTIYILHLELQVLWFLEMVKLTIVGRVSDGLALAQGPRYGNEENDSFLFYKQQGEFILEEISRGALAPSKMTILVDHHSFKYP